MRKSLITTWIANCDYPLYRAWLEKYHSWFDEIIICWDLSFRFPIFSSFIQGSLSHLPNVRFLDPIERNLGIEDWRNKATNEMVRQAKGDWIISLEQDLISCNWSKFFAATEIMFQTADMFGWMNMTERPYIHPACFFIKRDLLEKTSKDFSPHPEISGSDHFWMITQDALKSGAKVLPIVNLNFEVTPNADIFHLGGVNQAYLNGLDDPNYNFHRGEIFCIYNWWSMEAHVKQSTIFMERMKRMDMKLKNIYLKVDPEDNKWNKFFKL